MSMFQHVCFKAVSLWAIRQGHNHDHRLIGVSKQVGPFSNPSETYQYYNLPFCTPKEGKEYKTEGLGEVLEGDRLVSTPYSIKFRVDKENEILCSRELTEKDLKIFRKAVKKDYYFHVSGLACQSCSMYLCLYLPYVLHGQNCL